MSEHMLTTEEVRDDYQWGVHACSCCAERLDEDVEAFDRWLRSIKAEAWDEGTRAWDTWTFRNLLHPETRPNPYRNASAPCVFCGDRVEVEEEHVC